jgi:hypothetical protein
LGVVERQHRIKTEVDEFQKTKTNNIKINSVRKVNKEKEEKASSRQYISNKGHQVNRPMDDGKNKPLIDNTINKHRIFNKRLNLNS